MPGRLRRSKAASSAAGDLRGYPLCLQQLRDPLACSPCTSCFN